MLLQPPDTNHTANSVTGTLKDMLPQLKAELHRRHVPNIPFDAFLKHFVTLEDAQCAETAAENAAIGHTVPRKKYSESRNCKFLDAEVALLGPLYCSSALFGRRTNVWLAEMTIHKDNKVLGNNTSPTHIVIKIISRDMGTTLSEREIFNKAADYEDIGVSLLVPHIEFTY